MQTNTGEKIKEMRVLRNMTLKDLSELTDLSVSHLSQFERGIGSISMHSLERVAKALGTQLSYFLEAPAQHEGYILRSYDVSLVDTQNPHILHYQLGNQLTECTLEPMLVTLLPQQRREDSYPKPHQGEEFIYVLEGVLTVLIDADECTLMPGDSMHYQASSPHEWLNLTSQVVRLLSVNTPRILPA